MVDRGDTADNGSPGGSDMTSSIYIAVDGGASATRIRVADGHGGERADIPAGPTSLTLKGRGAWTDILDALAGHGVGAEDLPRAHCGLGLAGANDDRQRRLFLAAAPKTASLVLATDAYTSVLGAHRGAPGAVVAVGTGSVGCRLMDDGTVHLAGGWGFPVGDEGSGAWLGWRAIGEALLNCDRGESATNLHRAVIAHCGSDRASLLAWLKCASSTRYAELAPLVLDCARDGDAGALSLVRAAGAEIDRLALVLDPTRNARLALTGGLAAPLSPYLPAALTRWLRPARGDALDGAMMLARGDAQPEQLAKSCTSTAAS